MTSVCMWCEQVVFFLITFIFDIYGFIGFSHSQFVTRFLVIPFWVA